MEIRPTSIETSVADEVPEPLTLILIGCKPPKISVRVPWIGPACADAESRSVR